MLDPLARLRWQRPLEFDQHRSLVERRLSHEGIPGCRGAGQAGHQQVPERRLCSLAPAHPVPPWHQDKAT